MQRNIFLFGRKSIWSKELYLFDIKTYLSFRVESVSRQIGRAILLHFCLIVWESVSHDSQVASAPLRIVFACHPASGWHNQGSSNLKPQISILNSSRSTQPVAIARKGIRHTVHLTSDDRSETPPLRHFEWSKAESRNPPALRSLPLLSGKVFATLLSRTTFLHGKASHTILRSLALPYESCSLATPQAGGTIKVPQTSNLKSQISNLSH